jgi:hypothetical protein
MPAIALVCADAAAGSRASSAAPNMMRANVRMPSLLLEKNNDVQSGVRPTAVAVPTLYRYLLIDFGLISSRRRQPAGWLSSFRILVRAW